MKTLDGFIKQLQEIRKQAGQDIPVDGETHEGKRGVIKVYTMHIGGMTFIPPTGVIIEIEDLEELLSPKEDEDAL